MAAVVVVVVAVGVRVGVEKLFGRWSLDTEGDEH
jgi:hypothetical protein